MLCLRCWHWWPPGSRYCGTCQRPLNARICPDGHDNPLRGPQQTCNTCNRPLLQEGVPAIGMVWLGKGIAICVLVWLGYQAVLHLNLILCVVWKTGCWLLSFVLCHIPAQYYHVVENLIAWWISLYLLSHLLPKDIGSPFRGWLVRIGQAGFRLAGTGAVLLGKGIAGLFQAVTRRSKRPMGKSGRKGKKTADNEEQDR